MADIKQLLDGVEKRAKEAERHVSLCGPCDGGLPMACTCATVDPRETISELIAAVREQNSALRAVLDIHKPLLLLGRRTVCDICLDSVSYEESVDYPCPTVRAITEALVKSDG